MPKRITYKRAGVDIELARPPNFIAGDSGAHGGILAAGVEGLNG